MSTDATTGAAAAAPQRVETQVWEPDTTPGREGYLRLVRTKTVGEVWQEIDAIVGQYPDGGEEYFAATPSWGGREWPCPPGGRIIVYAVNGSSEGDYVHVDVVDVDRGRVQCVLLAKTFAGRDAAWQFARRLADLLEA